MRAPTWAVIVGALWWTTAAAAEEPMFEERSVVELSPAEGARFSAIGIDNGLGDVRIEGHESDGLMILAIKRAPTRDVVERLKVSLVPNPSGPVQIRTTLSAGIETRPVPAGSVRIDLVIRVPRTAEVSARTWNGKVDAEGLNNGAALAANEGEIRVVDVNGAVTTETAQGAHHLTRVFGAVSAQAMTGDVTLDTIRGSRLLASAHRGVIVGRGLRVEQLTVRTTFGRVDLEVAPVPGAELAVRTFRGDIRVRSRGRSAVTVRAVSRHGDVDLPSAMVARVDGKGRRVGRLQGDGRPAMLSLGTRHGNIQFAVIDGD